MIVNVVPVLFWEVFVGYISFNITFLVEIIISH